MRHAFALLLLTACGGKLDTPPTGDAGNESADASGSADTHAAKPDASPTTCNEASGYIEPYLPDDGGCKAEETWTCGAEQYSVTCWCPSAVCICQDNAAESTITTSIACPGCDVVHNVTTLAQLCGFTPPAP